MPIFKKNASDKHCQHHQTRYLIISFKSLSDLHYCGESEHYINLLRSLFEGERKQLASLFCIVYMMSTTTDLWKTIHWPHFNI